MRTIFTKLKAAFIVLLCALPAAKSDALTYTAILSGNFNSATTWLGGLIPGLMLTADSVVIPSGITVNLNTVESFSGTSSLTVNGTLTSSSGSALIMTSGALAGSGSIALDSMALGLTSGYSFTGSLMAQKLTSLGATLSSSSMVTVSSLLNLSAGSLNVSAGSLTLGNNSNVDVTGGSMVTGGSGMVMLDSVYNVWYTGASATTGLELKGSGLDSVNVNVSGTVTLSSNDTMKGVLTLTGGTLALNGYNLTLTGSGNISSMGSGTLTGSSTSSLTINTTGSITGSLNFAGGANVLDNLTLNSTSGSSNVNLGGDLTIDGMLNLSSGMLSLNNHTLTLNTGSSFTSASSGSLNGTASSNLIINSAGSLTGSLNFASGGNMLDNLTLNFGSGTDTVNLGTNLTVHGSLNLQSGRISLGSNNLTIDTTGFALGGSAGSYVATNGTGSLVMYLATGNTDTFKVGAMAGYSPMTIMAGSGSANGNVSISAMTGVLSAGTSGTSISATSPVVNATWMVSSTAMTSGINYTMTAMWSSGMEVNAFDRTNSFISHYHGGVWDTTTASAAGSFGSLYTQTRTGITSLSPFTVANPTTFTTAVPMVASNSGLDIYPNPTSDVLYFTAPAGAEKVAVYDMLGKQVLMNNASGNAVAVQNLPAGNYIVRFTGNNVNVVKQFVKE